MTSTRLQRALLVLLATVCFAGGLLAQETVTVRGTGKDERDAIKHALSEAICRVNGASVESKSALRQEVRDVVSAIEAEFDYQTDERLDVVSASKGHVRRYDLLSSQPTADGREVEIRAVVLRFDPENPRPGSRKTIVIERFELAPGALALDSPAEGADVLLSRLQDQLTTRVVGSRKFTVLTRKNLRWVDQELAFLETRDVAPEERAKLGALLGADYVVAGRLDRLAVHTERKTVKLTGYSVESKSAEVRLTLSVYNVGSGAIEWEESYTRDFSWGDDELERDGALRNDGPLAVSMLELGAEDLSRRLLMRTFPPKVMLIDRETAAPTFYLNAGEALLSVGDTLDLVSRGAPLLDPDTGEVLGHLDRRLGTLRVVTTEAKLSRAQLVAPTPEILVEVGSAGFDATTLVCLWR